MDNQHVNENQYQREGGPLGDIAIDNKPLAERLIDLRDEANSMIPHTNAFRDLEREIVGKWRQCLQSCILWVSQWQKNKDYSGAINAAMALGKLATATVFLREIAQPGTAGAKYLAVADACDQVCEKCWEAIRDAAGRIVPFEG